MEEVAFELGFPERVGYCSSMEMWRVGGVFLKEETTEAWR